MVVREANRKKRVKWCKERRGRTVDNYWEKLNNVFRWKSDCARYKQPSLRLAKRRRKPTSHLFSLWKEDNFDDLGMYVLWRCWTSGCSWRQYQLLQVHWHPRQERMTSSCLVFWRKRILVNGLRCAFSQSPHCKKLQRSKRSNLNRMASTITRFKYNRKYLALHEERATKVRSRYRYS